MTPLAFSPPPQPDLPPIPPVSLRWWVVAIAAVVVLALLWSSILGLSWATGRALEYGIAHLQIEP